MGGGGKDYRTRTKRLISIMIIYKNNCLIFVFFEHVVFLGGDIWQQRKLPWSLLLQLNLRMTKQSCEALILLHVEKFLMPMLVLTWSV